MPIGYDQCREGRYEKEAFYQRGSWATLFMEKTRIFR